MSYFQRFLLLGSIGMLVLAGLLLTFSPKAPIAHAACSQGCANNPCPPSQSENNSNNNTSWVEVIQFSLNSEEVNDVSGYQFPYWPLVIDGNFGSKTETAVADWQHYIGISNGGGVVGDRTWESLGLCAGFIASARYGGNMGNTCPPAQSENSSSNSPVFVQAIQDMLNQLYAQNYISNSYPDTWSPYLASDGSFGTQAYRAVVNFQFSENISGGGGVVGSRTWSAFRMCF